MRPHAGVGQAQAHVTLSTGVVSHTLTFHEPFAAADWLLLSHHSPYAGRGRSYGRADVFRADGALVASYVQDAMIRPKDAGRPGRCDPWEPELRVVLTAISDSENMVSMAAALMHEGLGAPRDASEPGTRSGPTTTAGRSRTSTAGPTRSPASWPTAGSARRTGWRS